MWRIAVLAMAAIAAAMSLRRRIGVALAVLAVTAGCDAILGGESNPAFCEAHPSDPECRRMFPDAAPDGPTLCMASSECEPPTAVCDLEGTRTCVQCTTSESAACTATTPVCIANQCQRCTLHSQCPASNVCLPDGACAATETVAYVAPAPAGTDNDACTKQMPCTQVKKALVTGRPNLKLSGATDEAVSIDSQNVTVFADTNTILTSSQPGVVLEVRGSSRVAISDLEIAGAAGVASIGISLPAGATASVELRRVKVTNNVGGGIVAAGGTLTVAQSTISGNQGGGISATGGTSTVARSTIQGNQGVGISATGGALTVAQSTIQGNQGGGISATGGALTVAQSTIQGNQGGGISVTGGTTVFSITDNFIVSNGLALGAAASLNGGVVATSNTPGSKLERNTVAFNQSTGQAFQGGVFCSAALVAASGNLIYHNSEADGVGTVLKTNLATQRNTIGSTCLYGNTLAVDTVAGDLGFASVVPPSDFHLTAASPASVVNAGGACTGIDVDGETRPSGAACDLGADEYVAPAP